MDVGALLVQGSADVIFRCPENPLPKLGKIRHRVHQFWIKARSAVSMPVVGEEALAVLSAAKPGLKGLAASFHRGFEGAGHPDRIAGHGDGGIDQDRIRPSPWPGRLEGRDPASITTAPGPVR